MDDRAAIGRFAAGVFGGTTRLAQNGIEWPLMAGARIGAAGIGIDVDPVCVELVTIRSAG